MAFTCVDVTFLIVYTEIHTTLNFGEQERCKDSHVVVFYQYLKQMAEYVDIITKTITSSEKNISVFQHWDSSSPCHVGERRVFTGDCYQIKCGTRSKSNEASSFLNGSR